MSYIDKIQVDGVDYDLKAPQIYDDQERVIGTWFGKPLYRQVVFVSSSINANTEVASSTSIQNVDNVIKLYGFCIWSISSSNFNFPIPYISKENNQRVQIFFNDNKVKVGTNMAITNVYSIIEYTKTTDIVE